MIVLVVLSLGLAILIGVLLIRLIAPSPYQLLQGTLGAGVGVGAVPICFFLWLAISGHSSSFYPLVEVALAASLVVASRRRACTSDALDRSEMIWPRVLWVALALALL